MNQKLRSSTPNSGKEREIDLHVSVSIWFGQCCVIIALLLLILYQHCLYRPQPPGLCKQTADLTNGSKCSNPGY